MAASDYRLCDVCDGKAFYDSNLYYESGTTKTKKPYRIAGKQQYEDATINEKYGLRLGSLGDWAVICDECAKKFKTQIVPI
jgi:hypothetical protein